MPSSGSGGKLLLLDDATWHQEVDILQVEEEESTRTQ